MCKCVNLWGLLQCWILAFSQIVIIQKEVWAAEAVNELIHCMPSFKASIGPTRDAFGGIKRAFLRVSLWHLHILQHPFTCFLFWNAFTCFEEKNSVECCPFVGKERVKEQSSGICWCCKWRKGTEPPCSLCLCTSTSPGLSSWSLCPLHPLSTSTNQNCMCGSIPGLSVPVVGPCLFCWRIREEGLKAELLQPGHNLKNNFTCALLSVVSSNLSLPKSQALTFNLSQALLEALPWFAGTHGFLEKQEISLCYFNPAAFI